MLSILNRGQSFVWNTSGVCNIVDSLDEFYSLPSPKIVLLDSADKWYDFDRSIADLTVYWVSEALANERAEEKPIIKLHPNDRVFSSSDGPDNQFNLHYWLKYMQVLYLDRYRLLIPKNEIFVNNVCCTLGQGRISRIYTFHKLEQHGLLNRNVSFSTDNVMPWLMPDACDEMPGQNEIYKIVKNLTLRDLPRQLELDWRKTKKITNWWCQHVPGIVSGSVIPTRAYLDSSLLFINESIIHNPEFFMTEKTIKGLLSGRPFIVIGCHRFLEKLRDTGFKTWASVLDESYDEIANIKDRIDRAIESAEEFIKSNVLNHPKRLQEIQQITDHNKEVFFKTDWSKNMVAAKKQILSELGIA